MNRIITVGREFGSGGREIGRLLAERLNIAYYDHEIVMELENRTAFAAEYIQSVQEKRPISALPLTTGRTLWIAPNPMVEQRLEVMQMESEILREMAERSSCVIVGRCADYILREKAPFRLFLYADMKYKLARCRAREAASEKLTDRELRKRISQVDKARAEYYAFRTGQTWGAKENYDLCIQTSAMPVEQIVSGILAFL